MSHIRVGVYAVTNGTAKEAADKAQKGMLSVFRGQPGFQAYGLAEAQDGKVISVSLWDSADQAQKANEVAASWVRENVADRIRLESTQVGDFFFYETA
jgi:heme-degrading monooxygenase HmoA